jgi:hypothetical protein
MLKRAAILVLVLLATVGLAEAGQEVRPAAPESDDPFGAMELPRALAEQFWADPAARKLLEMEPKAVADLVPVQSGLRFCRCPACGAGERDEPLSWTLLQPTVLKCRRCGVVVPNDKFPAKVKDKVPEETVEVLPGVVHHYPYHAVEENEARYPDERLYLRARIDYEARKYLARAALQAAIRARAGGRGADPRLAALACVIMLRFAQVYPCYAIHHDQPDRPKTLQPARLLPPYRGGFQTAKWDWSSSLEVPLNLVMACSLLRQSPGWSAAGKLLGDAKPMRTVERDLFRLAVEFALKQPREFTVEGLAIDRGLLAVARLQGDDKLADIARRRLEEFFRRGFYHDGLWRDAEAGAHRQVMGMLDGWVLRELSSRAAVVAPAPTAPDSAAATSLLALARRAGSALASRSFEGDIRQASWAGRNLPADHRKSVLLGGAGVARLAMGEGAGAIDLEVRGQDSYSRPRFQRLALRLSIGGAPVLDDLDERGTTGTGWELATPSHNLVVVDGLNQRETPALAALPAAGSNFLFFAAESDFQVVSVGDPRAYPQSTTRYRQTIVLTGSERSRYVLSVFEVHGGLQHDQIFHAASSQNGTWSIPEPTVLAPASLLPATIRFLPSAPLEQGRWFVQAYGEFRPEFQASLTRPAIARLARPAAPNDMIARASNRGATATAIVPEVRLHLLGDPPATAITAASPDATEAGPAGASVRGPVRSSLILRRRSERGETLRSIFVTVIEPVGAAFAPLRRVGRVESPPDVVVLMVETAVETEYLLVNLEPGSTRRVQLPSGRYVSFDGLALRVREGGLALAGGTFAEGSGRLASSREIAGPLTGAIRQASQRGLGWFLTTATVDPDPALGGSALVVEHGDGTRRAWTLACAEPIPGGTRLYVREVPGFTIDPGNGSARYDQYPEVTAPGPHRFRVSRISR